MLFNLINNKVIHIYIMETQEEKMLVRLTSIKMSGYKA